LGVLGGGLKVSARKLTLRGETIIPDFYCCLISENHYEAANPMRAGGLEKDEPILSGIKSLRYGFALGLLWLRP
jgi:hypothetical protein